MADLEKMNLEELEQYVAKAQAQIEQKKAERLEENRRKVEEYALSLGTSIAELFGTPKATPKATKRTRKPLYVTDEGKIYYRKIKDWTEEERTRFEANAKAL